MFTLFLCINLRTWLSVPTHTKVNSINKLHLDIHFYFYTRSYIIENSFLFFIYVSKPWTINTKNVAGDIVHYKSDVFSYIAINLRLVSYDSKTSNILAILYNSFLSFEYCLLKIIIISIGTDCIKFCVNFISII